MAKEEGIPNEKTISKEEIPLKYDCFFNNKLKCHPRTTDKFDSVNFADYISFVEKVCVSCPTHIFIKNKGIPR